MALQKLISIDVQQGYLNGVSPDNLEVIPTAECERVCNQFKLVKKKGLPFLVLSDNNADAVNLSENQSFEFLLLCKDRFFLQYTNLKASDAGELRLYDQATAAEQRTRFAVNKLGAPLSPHNIIGLIKLSSNLAAPLSVQIKLEPVLIKWKYYILAEQGEPQWVVDGTIPGITFKSKDRRFTDPARKTLTTRFPDAAITVFESETEVVSSGYPLKNIRLKNPENNMTMISHLPNPGPKDSGVVIINLLT